jgi:hypothetical protein
MISEMKYKREKEFVRKKRKWNEVDEEERKRERYTIQFDLI